MRSDRCTLTVIRYSLTAKDGRLFCWDFPVDELVFRSVHKPRYPFRRKRGKINQVELGIFWELSGLWIEHFSNASHRTRYLPPFRFIQKVITQGMASHCCLWSSDLKWLGLSLLPNRIEVSQKKLLIFWTMPTWNIWKQPFLCQGHRRGIKIDQGLVCRRSTWMKRP